MELSAQEKKDDRNALLLNDLLVLENYIHDLWNFSPLPICFVSPIEVILEANPAFEEISGYRMDQIVSESVSMFFSDKDVRKLRQEILDKGFIRGQEMTFFPKSGKKIIVQIFTKERKNEKGESTGYFLGLFDLTGVKQVEGELKDAQTSLLNILDDTKEAMEEVQEERNKTQVIIKGLSDGLLFFDHQQRLALINPQAENFLKVNSQDVLGKRLSEVGKSEYFRKLANVLGKKVKHFSRKELSIKEGFILEVSSIPLSSQAQKRESLVVLHDISREKNIEKMKSQFVSIAAHQLRTPLSAIKWTIRMLLDGDLGDVSQEQRQFLSQTYGENERMISLVNSLLNVSRIEEGRFIYRTAKIDIKKLVNDLINTYMNKINKRKIKLTLKASEEVLPKINVDKEKIELAIDNLVENAIDYTPDKGKIIISLNFSKTEKAIIFSIKDNGAGIPQEQQPRIFTKFFRATNARKIRAGGNGLGLFISKNIIEAHGGKIWFESKQKRGTTFYFSLPIQETLKRP